MTAPLAPSKAQAPAEREGAYYAKLVTPALHAAYEDARAARSRASPVREEAGTETYRAFLRVHCAVDDAEAFFTAYAEQFGFDPAFDLEALIEAVAERRIKVGFFAEENLPRSEEPGAGLVRAAAVDNVIRNYVARAQDAGIAFTGDLQARSEFAVARWAWCRLGETNEQVLIAFLHDHGFPDAERYGRAVAASGQNLYTHLNPESPAVGPYYAAAGAAFAEGVLNAFNYGLIEDTYRSHRGEPSLYGIEMTCRDGEAVLAKEIVDPDNLDARRAEIGLPPVAEHLAGLQPRCERIAGVRGG